MSVGGLAEVAWPRKSSRDDADEPLVRFGATVVINTADMNGGSLIWVVTCYD